MDLNVLHEYFQFLFRDKVHSDVLFFFKLDPQMQSQLEDLNFSFNIDKAYNKDIYFLNAFGFTQDMDSVSGSPFSLVVLRSLNFLLFFFEHFNLLQKDISKMFAVLEKVFQPFNLLVIDFINTLQTARESLNEYQKHQLSQALTFNFLFDILFLEPLFQSDPEVVLQKFPAAFVFFDFMKTLSFINEDFSNALKINLYY